LNAYYFLRCLTSHCESCINFTDIYKLYVYRFSLTERSWEFSLWNASNGEWLTANVMEILAFLLDWLYINIAMFDLKSYILSFSSKTFLQESSFSWRCSLVVPFLQVLTFNPFFCLPKWMTRLQVALDDFIHLINFWYVFGSIFYNKNVRI